MTEPHRATDEQWGAMYEGAFYCDAESACILELRARVEALEAANYPAKPDSSPAPAGSLVEQVAQAMHPDSFSPAESWGTEARAAIREVAAWLDTKGQHGCSLWLREEADRA